MIAYIFKSSLSLILLFGLYWLLLRKEKLFIFNRFFLVISVVFSLILPFISVPVNFQTTRELKNIIPVNSYIIPEISTSEYIARKDINIEPSSVEIQPSVIDISTILVILYFSGAILLLLRFKKNIYHMYRQIRLSEKIKFKGYRLVLTDENTNPYCFFNNIFLNRDDYLNGRIDNDLLNHELMHITQYHSVDIIFLELIKIFYWFNPVYLLYDRAIRINHEYLADHGVIHDDYDIKNYSDKLLSFIFTRSNIPLTSGSNHSFTRRRVLMMTKTRSKSSIYGFRIAITLSVIVVFSLFLSFKQSNKQASYKETDSGGLTDIQAQTVKDIDGNEYKTVTIGTQIWMAENLKTTRYNDDKDIRMVTDSTEWQQYEQAFCWYNNKTENKNEYGALYNWYAVNTNKLCPIGWHVPVKEELLPLMKFSSKDTLIGGTMKEAGVVHWKIPNKGATNETGFSALPGGFRLMNGEFGYIGEFGRWWTSSEENSYIGFSWMLSYNNGNVVPNWPSKRVGLSVRCLKDNFNVTFNSSINSGETLQHTVRGIVLTEDGKPLMVATIITTGPNNTPYKEGTGFDGRFTIDDIQAGATFLVECRGFISQTLKADFGSEMVIRLARDPDYKGKILIPEIQNVNFRNSDFTPGNALVVIDGVIIDHNANFKVDPDEIKSFKVLTEKEATNKYGDKGKDGVVEIRLYRNKTESARKKPADSGNTTSDTSKYIKYLRVNHVTNNGELIDIPIPNLKYIQVWTYHDIDNIDKKELSSITIMTRDYFKVKGTVVQENGKPMSGVKISLTDNPVTSISDKEGHFVISDIPENALLEFSHPGFEPYYINTSFVPFNMDLTIELRRDGASAKDDIYVTAEKMPQYPGGDMALKKFIATNMNYPEEARAQKAEGVVIVRFVVNTEGNIEDVKLLQKVHPAIDTEALRVVGKLGRFIPGSQGGKLVKVYYNLSITFAL
jgi:TonB family protein